MKFLVAVLVVTGLISTARADVAASEAACKGGDAVACAQVGTDYQNASNGAKKDLAKAFAAFLRGCELGHIGNCNQAAVAYKSGLGVKKDLKRSVELLQKACSATTTDGVGRGWGCAELASAYNSGKGVKKDIGKANELYELACTLDSPYGCLVIGAAYAFGEGIKKDVVKGKAYLDKACKAGKKLACDQLEELARPPKKGGGGGTCPGNAEIRCGGVCVNIWKPDSRNCGGCGNVCPSNHFCNQGTCTMK
jgi:TPR repeat protein